MKHIIIGDGIVFDENPYYHFKCNKHKNLISKPPNQILKTLVRPNDKGQLPEGKFDIDHVSSTVGTINNEYIIVPKKNDKKEILLFIYLCDVLLLNNHTNNVRYFINETVDIREVDIWDVDIRDVDIREVGIRKYNTKKYTNIICLIREGDSIAFQKNGDNNNIISNYSCKDGDILVRSLSYQEKMQEDYEAFKKSEKERDSRFG